MLGTFRWPPILAIPQNSVEIAPTVGRQSLESMHVKRSDPKDFTEDPQPLCYKTSWYATRMSLVRVVNKSSWPEHRPRFLIAAGKILDVAGDSHLPKQVLKPKLYRVSTPFRRCPSTVPCTVPSGESPNFRWTPS